MTVEPTQPPPPHALSLATNQAMTALLQARSGGGADDAELAADFGRKVRHDVEEGRMDEGQAAALLLAYGVPITDMTEEPKESPKPKAKEPDDAPVQHHKADDNHDKKPAAKAKA